MTERHEFTDDGADDGAEDFQAQENEGQRDKRAADRPVENEGPLPLFPDAHRNTQRVVAYVRVTKMDSPADGYKGDVPATATLQFIGNLYGDGIYNLEACNAGHKVLRQRQGVKIAFGGPGRRTGNGTPSPTGDPHLPMRVMAQQHKDEVERLDKLTTRTTDQVTKQGDQFVTMVTKQAESSMVRDREFFKANGEQQGQFFQAMIAQQQAMHQQSMESQRAGFQQTIALMESMHARSAEQNNPAMLVSVLMRGLEMGRDMDSSEDDPDWIRGLNAGSKMLGDLRGLAATKDGSAKPAKRLPAKPNPKALPQKTGSGDTSGGPDATDKPRFSKEQIAKIAQFKNLCDERGVDFDNLLMQASGQVAGGFPGVGTPAEDDEQDDSDSAGEQSPDLDTAPAS